MSSWRTPAPPFASSAGQTGVEGSSPVNQAELKRPLFPLQPSRLPEGLLFLQTNPWPEKAGSRSSSEPRAGVTDSVVQHLGLHSLKSNLAPCIILPLAFGTKAASRGGFWLAGCAYDFQAVWSQEKLTVPSHTLPADIILMGAVLVTPGQRRWDSADTLGLG